MQPLSRAAALAAILIALHGCGPGEPKYHDISGAVNYDGKPVPKGTIYFEPDSSKGAKGKMGSADVVGGRYDTKGTGRGVLGGPYVIRLSSFDGKPTFDSQYGTVLCPEYSINKDLPAQDQTLDIDIPKAKRN